MLRIEVGEGDELDEGIRIELGIDEDVGLVLGALLDVHCRGVHGCDVSR